MDIKYRFTEIVTAISLLSDEVEDIPTLPDRTKGLSDSRLKSALAAQAFREGEQFSNKLTNALVGSAMLNIKETDNPSEDDMSAMGLAMSLTWAHNEIPYFLALSGLIAQVFEKFHTCDQDDYLIPSEVSAILGNGQKAKKFGSFEPYDILEDKVSLSDLINKEAGLLPDDIKEQLLKALQQEMDK